MSSRKDDPVFNVKFVQLVESKPCLWNSTLPEYSKKDEIQKAWQEVANETKDTVRNCRERWRTIRSSFLRSLKLSRTTTGRGKRKYYLSKYLQFLIPYTKTRLKNSASIIAQRKAAAAGNIPPMTRISNMPIVSSDDTKDSSNSADVAAIAEGDVVVALHEGAVVGGISITQHAPLPLPQPLNLQAIKQEKDVTSGIGGLAMASTITTSTSMANCGVTSMSLAAAADALHQRPFVNSHGPGGLSNVISSMQQNNSLHCNPVNTMTSSNKPTIVGGSSSINSGLSNSYAPPQDIRSVDLKEFADWIKSKNEHQRHCLVNTSSSTSSSPSPPDADQSFLNSLHPFLKEMSGKQNRRFRQKVVALIDAILDNAD